MAATHVVPVDDLREHVLNAQCWCSPRRDDDDGDGDGAIVWVHNSMDRREAYETGELRPA